MTATTASLPDTAVVLNAAPVQAKIHDLAAIHGVVFVETAMDRLADLDARLSDSEPETDDTERLLRALYRAGILSSDEHTDLHIAYLDEIGLY